MGAKSRHCLNGLRVHKTVRAGKYHDNKGHGLYLVVTPDGRKRWEQRITACGRRRTVGLGRYPDVSLSDARKRASRNCLLAFDGIDPIVHKRAQHRRVPTFAEAADGAISDRRKKWTNPQMEQRWRRSLERHVCPSLGHLLVSDIHTQDVAKVLKRLNKRLPKSVVRVRQQISVVLAWARGSGFRPDNPCGPALDAVLQLDPTKSGYHQALPHDQVSDALVRVRVADRWIGERLLLEFLVLTAVRTNEARGALWSEIDWGARRWTVPAERMKEREEHEVPLALQGHDVPSRVSRRRSVAHGRVLTGRDRCWREARPIVRWLGVCALHRCAEGGQHPGRVRLEVVTVGGAVRGGVGRLDAFGHELALLRVVSTLWDEAAAPSSDDPPARVGVVLEALRDQSAPCLFEADPRDRGLQWMLDRVRDRYGARALLWGQCADQRGPYTGAKIAYQSFPDMARLRWLGLVDAPAHASVRR